MGEEDLLNLGKLLSQKLNTVDSISIENLKMYVCTEERRQGFRKFSDRFSEMRHETFEDYSDVFSYISNEDFSFYEEKRKAPFMHKSELIEIVRKTIRLSKKISYFKQLIQKKVDGDASQIGGLQSKVRQG